MTESIKINSERNKESTSSAEVREVEAKKIEVNEVAAETKRSEQLESARVAVEKQTVSKGRVMENLSKDTAPNVETSHGLVSKALRQVTLDKELKHIRRRLSKPDRATSKVIHQPVIRVISDISSKTITRPSGLLGGGIVAFVGTGAYYLFTKYIGVRYNYLVFILLFILGYAVGVMIEIIIRSLRPHKKNAL